MCILVCVRTCTLAALWPSACVQAEPAHPEGNRLLQRVRAEVEAERRAEARAQKAAVRILSSSCADPLA